MILAQLVLTVTRLRRLIVKLVSTVTKLPLLNGISSAHLVPLLLVPALIALHALSALVATPATREVSLVTQHLPPLTTTNAPKVTSV